MIGRGASPPDLHRVGLEYAAKQAGTVEVVSGFPDWPLVCGRVRLRNGPVRSEDRREVKALLAARLWKRLEGLPDVGGSRMLAPVGLTTGELGRPLLLVEGRRIANVSFSYCSGELWAAVCKPGCYTGIDAARRQEFGAGYPYRRVFSPVEIACGLEITCGDPGEAAALLWSAKEAVVKVIGWGFHFLEPLDVKLEMAGRPENGCEMLGCLGGRRAIASPLVARVQVPVRTVRTEDCWVSVAVLGNEQNRRLTTAGLRLNPETRVPCESCW